MIRNSRDFVFQIYPKLSFELHKELRKNEKALKAYNEKEIVDLNLDE